MPTSRRFHDRRPPRVHIVAVVIGSRPALTQGGGRAKDPTSKRRSCRDQRVETPPALLASAKDDKVGGEGAVGAGRSRRKTKVGENTADEDALINRHIEPDPH